VNLQYAYRYVGIPYAAAIPPVCFHFLKRKQPSAPGLSWRLIAGAVLEAWKPRRPQSGVACSRWPLIYAIVGCAVRPRNGWLAWLSSRSMACSKVGMF